MLDIFKPKQYKSSTYSPDVYVCKLLSSNKSFIVMLTLFVLSLFFNQRCGMNDRWKISNCAEV